MLCSNQRRREEKEGKKVIELFNLAIYKRKRTKTTTKRKKRKIFSKIPRRNRPKKVIN